MDRVTIVAFVGPSGSGKSELVRRLLEMYPEHCTMWRQFTTRARRSPNDAYTFLTAAQYEAMRDLLVVRTGFNGNYYGTMPEAGSEGKAVLTIADKVGHADLVEAIEAHNGLVKAGLQGKLGAVPVRLLTAHLEYEPTEESISERGRASRGLEFIRSEAAGLAEFRSDVKIDTSKEWVDPEQFFSDYIWPALVQEDGQPGGEGPTWSRAVSLARLGADMLEAGKVPPEVAAQVEEYLEEVFGPHLDVRSAAEDHVLDGVDEALAAEEIPPAEEPGQQPPEAAAAEGPVQQLAEVVADKIVAAAEAAPPKQQPASKPDRMKQLREQAEREAAAAAAQPAAVPPPEPPPETAPPQQRPGPRFRTIGQLINQVDFEDWASRSGTGLTGFKSHDNFEALFRRYLRDNGASPAGVLSFPPRATVRDPKDKNSLIRYFEVRHSHDGQDEGFILQFSDKLQRPISASMIPGPPMRVPTN